MKSFVKVLTLAGALAVCAGAAHAQISTQVTQTGTRLDAATGLAGPLGTTTSCSTVNTTVANNTVTITPPAGQYVYITGFYLDITSNATGSTTVATGSFTNVTGSPVWSLATLAVATASGDQNRQISEVYATPLKSTTPGTAVTWLPSAQVANQIYCPRVAYYVAP